MQHGLASACYVSRTKLAVLVCVALTVLHDKPARAVETQPQVRPRELLLAVAAGG